MEYKLGSRDNKVGEIQRYLNFAREVALKSPQYEVLPIWGRLAVDNDFGEKTRDAVLGFQHMLKITENGIVGNTTWNNLTTFPSSVDAKVIVGSYELDSEKAKILEIQTLLNQVWWGLQPDVRNQYRWEYIAVDGELGTRTKQAVKAFQKYTVDKYGVLLPINGKVDPVTLHYLKNCQALCATDRFLTEFNRRVDCSSKNVSPLINVNLKDCIINSISSCIKKGGDIWECVIKIQNDFRNIFAPFSDRYAAMDNLDNMRNKPHFNRGCNQYVSDTMRSYFSNKGLAARIRDMANTEASIANARKLKPVGSVVNFIIDFRKPIYLLFHQEDTETWRQKFKKELFECFDAFLFSIAAQALVSVILGAVLGSVIGPEGTAAGGAVGGLIGIVIVVVEIILVALIAWLFAIIYKAISGLFLETRPFTQILWDNLSSTLKFNYENNIGMYSIPQYVVK